VLDVTSDPKIEAMQRVPLFARCSRKDLAKIAALADEIDIPAGKVLAREGERGREFFVVLEGSAEVNRDGRDVATLGTGDFFGEIALVTDKARVATVTATSETRVLVITDRAFRELLRNSPEIQGKVLEAVADRLAAAL
jgi:CRP/FNR family cyclic AMP-dependent transcriptional regulator